MIINEAQAYRNEVKVLLAAEKLPVADLTDTLNNFIVAVQQGLVIGVAGLEAYGKLGLLRSMAVVAKHRNLGIAGKLLDRIEATCKRKGIKSIYLLTETAPGYFEKKGFIQIDRAEVPVEIQQSTEFSLVCPVSAIVMKKLLK
jgi:amino-acid N-acetyltransferase